MKTALKFTAACLAAASVIGFVACESDSDTQKPTIQLISPEDDDILTIGEGVHLVMQLRDNEALGSYKVEIHPAEGHSHDTRAEEEEGFEKTWTFDDIEGLKEKDVDLDNGEIVIPTEATPGMYHLMIHCTDAAGNEREAFCEVELSLDGTHDPELDHDHE